MIKGRIAFLSIIIITSCQTSAIRDEQAIQEYFTAKDIKSLESILAFFDSEVMVDCYSPDQTECYNNFLSQIKEMYKSDNLDLGIDKHKQLSFINLLDSSTFNKIWEYSWIARNFRRPNQKNYCQLSYQYKGVYHQYLKDIADSNELIKNYVETFEMAGDISPTMIGDVIINYEKLDISLERERLFLAIHYLTLNHPLIEKLDNSICITPSFIKN